METDPAASNHTGALAPCGRLHIVGPSWDVSREELQQKPSLRQVAITGARDGTAKCRFHRQTFEGASMDQTLSLIIAEHFARDQ